jgi:clan AA aspartic protease (TIGR02281 family)
MVRTCMASLRTAMIGLVLLLPGVPVQAGVVFVDGMIEDKPVRFVVDTGADEISIPYAEAIRMGLPVFAGPRTESTTASGPVGVYRLTLASVTVGTVTLHDVAAHVSESDLGAQVVLLGMSFLGRVNVCLLQGKLQITDPAAEVSTAQSSCQGPTPPTP